MEAKGEISRRHFMRVAASLPVGLMIGMPGAARSQKSPFADAIALWHMGDAGDRAAQQGLASGFTATSSWAFRSEAPSAKLRSFASAMGKSRSSREAICWLVRKARHLICQGKSR